MRCHLEVAGDWRSEVLPIHLRCYSRPIQTEENPAGPGKSPPPRAKPEPNDIVLVFDTETTIDPSQRLRAGFYQLRVAGRLDEEGAFYDPAVLRPKEIAPLRAYCRARGLPEPMTLEDFREQVFLGKAYDCGAEIVGFNLPFDISRIAIGAGPARITKRRSKMRGGFSLQLSADHNRPNLQVKHLSARASVVEFAAERRQTTSRPDRKKQDYTPVHRGHFTDVRTLAAALTSRSHSLKSLTRALGTPTQKTESEEHGGPLSFEYLDYARSDVQATWECFAALVAKFRSYGLGNAHWEILSEAGLGKATLGAMGIRSWLSQNPKPSPELLAKIMCSYFGGRTEVRWRKTVRQVFHTDFTSMYPTVCTLQNLWRFIIATGFETRDATGETRRLLAEVTAADIQNPAFWPRLTTLVRVKPDDDLLPVRAPYCSEKNATIGLNHLTSSEAIWVTLADCIAAKILSGKAPQVIEAIGFAPGSVQSALKPIKLFGRHKVDPRTDDLFRRVIQLRIEEKARAESLTGSERNAVDDLCQSLKITANSSSYGIFIQVNVDTENAPVAVEVFTPDGGSFVTKSRKVERPGPFYHPLLATLITGAARLMLALAEHRATAEGLDWVFCDTDSLALARPEEMAEPDFFDAADRVLEWFKPLDPYGVGKSILKAERANFSMADGRITEPLYCLAISSKRYALFNLDPAGVPVIRKGSAHGLGHLLPPYGPDERTDGTLLATEGEDEELPLWQRDLWRKIVEHALQGRLDSMNYDYHPKLRGPALSRYAATSPELWRWFAPWNKGRSYAEGVKPFGFLYALHARKGAGIHPIAPFDRKAGRVIRNAFDRITGKAVRRPDLQTYSEALEGYHTSPESKFRNGEPFDSGRTERRHVTTLGLECIGKEADRYEEAFFLATGVDLTIQYGSNPVLRERMMTEVAEAAKAHGDSTVSRATGLPRAVVARVRSGNQVSARTPLAKVRRGLDVLATAEQETIRRESIVIDQLRERVREFGGVRKAARAMGVDFSNLAKRLKSRRRTQPIDLTSP